MSKCSSAVRVRFAPSPTGRMHLGSARTALYDYLIAKKTGGQFILRIEDTDRKRYVASAEQELMEGMRWLGMEWDEGPDKGGPFGPYRQSERKDIYLEYAKKLIDSRNAYYCFCTEDRLTKIRQDKISRKEHPRYDGLCRRIDPLEAEERVSNGEPHVIRFKTPHLGITTVNDLLRGKINVENSSLDDNILIKSDGWALYHLAAIVDDHLMKITHVLRSSEWLPSLPLHALIWRAFGWQEPIWVHLSVFLKPSGKGKMSKRDSAELNKDGYSIFVKDLENLGYLPEAVVNWSALMGWSFDDHTEFFEMKDLCEKFSLERLNPAPAAINFTKLDHFNKEHIKKLSVPDVAKRIQPFFKPTGLDADLETLMKITPHISERITTLDEAVELCGFLFRNEINYCIEQLLIPPLNQLDTCAIAREIFGILYALNTWEASQMEIQFTAYMQNKNLTPKQVYGFIREAVSGQKVTPPIFPTLEVLGREKTLEKMNKAIAFLS